MPEHQARHHLHNRCARTSLRRAARTRQSYRRYALEWQIRQLQKGQHETFVFLGNLGVGISAERLAAGDFDAYDEVFLLLDNTDDYAGDVETRPAARCLTISFRGTHGRQARAMSSCSAICASAT